MTSSIISALLSSSPLFHLYSSVLIPGNRTDTNLQTRVAMMTHQAVQQQSALGCSSFLLRRQHR